MLKGMGEVVSQIVEVLSKIGQGICLQNEVLIQIREELRTHNEIELIRTEILAAHVEKTVDVDLVRHRRRLDSMGDKIWIRTRKEDS